MKTNKKRIAAITGILFLIALYLLTFVSSLLKIEYWDRLFLACIAATVFVPILIWIYIWLYGKITDRHTMASIDFNKEDTNRDSSGKDAV